MIVAADLLLKLVQLTSNLRGGKELLEKGFTYEWSILHRVIDEAVQHTLFLLTADRMSQWERKHDDVLTAFFQDDVTRKGTVSTQPPKHVSATDIHSALQMAIEEESDNIPPEFLGRAAPTLKSLRKIKSGFVHGRAASISRGITERTRHGEGLRGEIVLNEWSCIRVSVFGLIILDHMQSSLSTPRACSISSFR